MTVRKIIIDTDPGIDDMQAIMMAFAKPELVEVIAITIVAGNGSLEQGYTNAKKLLKYIGKESTPLYKGSHCTLKGEHISNNDYHGPDSFANNPLPEVTDYKVEEINAPQALIELTKKYPKEIELVAIGPLTNLALAYLMDHDFPNRLKALHIMGGDRAESTYNNINEWSEFNCWIDPPAFQLVFKRFGKINGNPIKVIDFTFCNEHLLTKEYMHEFYGIGKEESLNIRGKFNRLAFEHMSTRWLDTGVSTADPFSMYLCIYPDAHYKSRIVYLDDVSLNDANFGHSVFKESPNGNIEMIDDIDMEDFKKVWMETMKK